MKRKKAKEILAESFRELAESKSIAKITVRDITENCGYSTATFYRHFKDKYDLIAWDYTCELEQILKQVGRNRESWKQALIDAAVYYDSNREYLANLLLHTTGYDSFVRNMTEINFNSLKNRILFSSELEELEEKTEMYVRLYCLGNVCLTCEWILGRYSVSRETLVEVYAGSLPEPLHPYLL